MVTLIMMFEDLTMTSSSSTFNWLFDLLVVYEFALILCMLFMNQYIILIVP